MSTKLDSKEVAKNSLMQQLKKDFTTEELNKVFILFPELLALVLVSALPNKKAYQYIVDSTNNPPRLIIPRIILTDSEEEIYLHTALPKIDGITLRFSNFISPPSTSAFLFTLEDYGFKRPLNLAFFIWQLSGSLITTKLCQLIEERINKTPPQPHSNLQAKDSSEELLQAEIQTNHRNFILQDLQLIPTEQQPIIQTENPQSLLNKLGPPSAQLKALASIEKILSSYADYLEQSCVATWQQEVTKLKTWKQDGDPGSKALATSLLEPDSEVTIETSRLPNEAKGTEQEGDPDSKALPTSSLLTTETNSSEATVETSRPSNEAKGTEVAGSHPLDNIGTTTLPYSNDDGELSGDEGFLMVTRDDIAPRNSEDSKRDSDKRAKIPFSSNLSLRSLLSKKSPPPHQDPKPGVAHGRHSESSREANDVEMLALPDKSARDENTKAKQLSQTPSSRGSSSPVIPEVWIEMREISSIYTIVEPSSPLHQRRNSNNSVEKEEAPATEPATSSDNENTFG